MSGSEGYQEIKGLTEMESTEHILERSEGANYGNLEEVSYHVQKP